MCVSVARVSGPVFQLSKWYTRHGTPRRAHSSLFQDSAAVRSLPRIAGLLEELVAL